MNQNYPHYNGNIINGNWEAIDNPEFLYPKINGKNLVDLGFSVKHELMDISIFNCGG